jgi:hypothetical protein
MVESDPGGGEVPECEDHGGGKDEAESCYPTVCLHDVVGQEVRKTLIGQL